MSTEKHNRTATARADSPATTGSAVYGERDSMGLGEYYVRHVSAMTSEGLHAKSAIAAELAYRDEQIDQLLDALRSLNAHYEDLCKSNPGFMGKMCLQDYALWNESLLKSERVLARYPQTDKRSDGSEPFAAAHG